MAEAGRVTRYVTDEPHWARAAVAPRRECSVCATPLGDRTRGDTCPRSYARCHNLAIFVPSAEFPSLPASPVPMIRRPETDPPMAVYKLPSLAELAVEVAA